MARLPFGNGLRLALAACLASALSLHAEDLAADPGSAAPAQSKPQPRTLRRAPARWKPALRRRAAREELLEADADASYVGGARTNFGRGRNGDVSEQDTQRAFRRLTPQWGDGPIYRFGLGLPAITPSAFPGPPRCPNTLQSFNAIVGADFALFNSWVVRLEAEPGIYSDFHHVTSGDFNVPFEIGGSYIASAEVQWVRGPGHQLRPALAGFSGCRGALGFRQPLDARRGAPLPAPGVRVEQGSDALRRGRFSGRHLPGGSPHRERRGGASPEPGGRGVR